MTDTRTPSELRAAVRLNDRKYRSAIYALVTIVILTLAITVVALVYQNRQFQAQSAERAAGLNRILKAQRDENAKQTRYIQCIARFFATVDRTNLVLTDLDKCNYQKNGEPVPGVDLTPITVQSVTNQQKTLPTGVANTSGTTINQPNNNNGDSVDNSILPANPIVNLMPAPLTVTLPIIPKQILKVNTCVSVLQLCVTN